MRINKRKEVDAFHQSDLRPFLDGLGFLKKFDSNEIKCSFCREIIKEKNFGAVYPEENDIFFACSKLDCLAKIPNLKK